MKKSQTIDRPGGDIQGSISSLGRHRWFGLDRSDAAPLCLAAVFLIVCLVWLTLVRPRPFTIMENDLENSYFYNSLTLRDGFYAQGELHPGTPARYAYLLLFKLFGYDTGPRWQASMNWAYTATGVLILLGIFIFYVMARCSTLPQSAFLALVCALTSPPSLHHLNHFGSDSFILPLGLPLIGLSWATISDPARPRTGRLACIGALCGLCLSIKLTFAPLVMLVLTALSLALLTRRDGPAVSFKRRAAMAAALWIEAAVVHMTVCLPLQLDLIDLWLFRLLRSEAIPAGSWMRHFIKAFLVMARANPVLAGIAVVAFSLSFFRIFVRVRKGGIPGLPAAAPEIVLVIGGMVCLSYGLIISYKLLGLYSDAGNALRLAGPVLLVIPFFVLASVPRRTGKRSAISVVIVSTAILMIISSAALHAGRREHFLAQEHDRASAVTERLSELRVPGTRIAFWDRAAGASFGEATFRFWGNYAWYRQEQYDAESLTRFPMYTFFRLREIDSLDPQPAQNQALSPHSSPLTFLRAAWGKILRWRIPSWFPHRDASNYSFAKGKRALFTGEDVGVRVSVIAYPIHDEKRENVTRARIVSAVADRLGPVTVTEEVLGNERWVIIRIKSPAGQSVQH